MIIEIIVKECLNETEKIYFVKLKDISVISKYNKTVYFKKRSGIEWISNVFNFDEILDKFKKQNE